MKKAEKIESHVNVLSMADKKIAEMEKKAEQIIANKDEQTEDELLIQLAFMLSCCCDIFNEILERRT